MTVVARLSADLDIKTARFEAGIARARQRVRESQTTFDKFFNANKKGFGAVGGAVDTIIGRFASLKSAVVAVVGAGGLALLIKQQISAASAIKDTADRLQIGTTALQKYQYAAKQVGASNETLEAGIGKLNSKLADGSLKYESTGEALNSIADAVKNAKTEQQRLNIVNDAFGDKLGRKMLPLLKDGAAGLKALGDEAQRTGNVIKDSTIQAADELGDNLDALVSTIEKNFSQGFLDELVGQTSDLRDVYTDPKFAEGIKNLGGAFGDLSAQILKAASALGNFIGWYQELADKVHKWDKETWDKIMNAGSEAFDSPENRQKYLNRKNAIQYPLKVGEVYGPVMGAASGTPDIPTGKPKGWKPSGKTDKETSDSLKAIFDGLKNETDQLKIQTSTYGMKTSAIERARKQMEIQNKLAADGIKLNATQQEQLNTYLDTLEQQKQLQAAQEKYNSQMQDFTDAVSSSFEDAIVNGGKLSDVFNSLLKDIERMIIKKSLLEPLFGDGSAGSSGFLTSILGDIGGAIFGPSPTASHATGQARVPYDMNVRVHKNEKIVPASENMRGGGGVELVVNMHNNNGSKVSQNAKQNGNGVELNVMIDQAVAKNISRAGSRTSQAMTAKANRTLVRR